MQKRIVALADQADPAHVDSLRQLTEMLGRRGLEVLPCRDATAVMMAFAEIGDGKPVLLITNLRLPRGNDFPEERFRGAAVGRTLRDELQKQRVKKIPVILYSHDAQAIGWLRGMNVDEHTKVVDLREGGWMKRMADIAEAMTMKVG